MKTKIGQMLMIGVQGHTLSQDEKKFIVENNIGGVILFGRNYADPQQLHELCQEIHSLSKSQADKSPLFIGIDQEGGRVQRIKKEPFPHWPPLAMAGKVDNTSVTFMWAHLLSEELKSFGINLNFAPALDVLTNPKNTVIGDRAISDDYRIVEKHASAWVRGALKAGILSCAKHFPGHGNTLLDSHEDLPKEHLSLEQLEERELVPFKKSFRSKVDFVMLAHIVFDKIDPQWPASLSKIFVEDILRQQMGFRGIIFTDDLDMGALKKNFSKEDIAVQAFLAGAEILLYCNEPDSPHIALDSLLEALAQERIDKNILEQTHLRIQIEKKQKLKGFQQPSLKDALAVLHDPKRKEFLEDLKKGIAPDLSVFQPEK